VTIINLDTDEEKVYNIVGEDEADIKVGKISLKSPIARALIGKNEGDEVRVTTPGGVIEYEIAGVQHIA
jgi:transcription elongation factor GreA